MRTLTLLICVFAAATVALSQEKAPAAAPATVPDNPYSAWTKNAYGYLKGILLSSAEKMPEENYKFKPADTVRSYGQILGHIADSQYYFCSVALGEKNPALKIEQTKSSKADLIAALKDSSAYCDKAYDGMTDASGRQTVKMFGENDTPKLSVLTVNNMHDLEHYGNLVTYMRIKGMVPPTSEQRLPEEPKK